MGHPIQRRPGHGAYAAVTLGLVATSHYPSWAKRRDGVEMAWSAWSFAARRERSPEDGAGSTQASGSEHERNIPP
jgi:hypothetical protein